MIDAWPARLLRKLSASVILFSILKIDDVKVYVSVPAASFGEEC